MKDQAQRLRELYETRSTLSSHVITVASGKGGVGKSNFALNFALGLKEVGKKVVVIDFDIGMANLHILMGIVPKYNLIDMVKQHRTIWDTLETGMKGVEYVAGGTGLESLTSFTEEERTYFLQELEKLHGYADYIIIDTGAGLTEESLQCHLAADEIFLLTTPEPTSIADAYSVAKILHANNRDLSFQLIINRIANRAEGIEVASKFKLVFGQFLNRDIKIFGAITDDAAVRKAVQKQIPFSIAYPHCHAASDLQRLVKRYVANTTTEEENHGVKGFLKKFSKLFK
ncbi:MinD/ParA family protein [Ectobacillus polymachus]|uniref:MinD/ParA family protein n=1 Tax=Ectobacillus polymachus TaxID=1508806 RepID=UPI003A8A99DA